MSGLTIVNPDQLRLRCQVHRVAGHLCRHPPSRRVLLAVDELQAALLPAQVAEYDGSAKPNEHAEQNAAIHRLLHEARA